MLAFTLQAMAQKRHELRGNILDLDSEALIGAQINLLQNGETVLASISDHEGSFLLPNLPEGDYELRVSYMGQTDTWLPLLSIKADTAIVLHRPQGSAHELQEVSITGTKPFMDVRHDKIVLNVENSLMSTGSSVMEVLQNAPGIRLDEQDNFTLRGRPGVAIWIDGKPSPLQGADLASVLKSMPADAVGQIEIVFQPGAGYDASGGGGIIHIKTKKDKRQGSNGTLNAHYGQGRYPKYGIGASWSFRNPKWSFNALYQFSYRSLFNHLKLDRHFYDGNGSEQTLRYEQDNFSQMAHKSHMAQWGAEYRAGERTLIGSSISTNFNAFAPRSDNRSRALDGQDRLLYYFDTQGQLKDRAVNYSANINARHQMLQEKASLSIDLDVARFENESQQQFRTLYTLADGGKALPDYQMKSTINGHTQIKALKLEYKQELSGGAVLEAGAKASMVRSDNDPLFLEATGGDYALDHDRSRWFQYDEGITAAYINLQKNIAAWDVQLGLRAERTRSEGEQAQRGRVFDTSYLQLFPNLSLRHLTEEGAEWGISIARRIDRPGYPQLNPIKYFVDKTTYKEGNPYLRPSTLYLFALSRGFKKGPTLNLSYSIARDAMVTVIQPSDREDSVSVQTIRNLDRVGTWSLSGTYSVPLMAWWSCISTFNIEYAHYQGTVAYTPIDKGRPAFEVSVQQSWALPWGLSGELGFQYRSRQLYGYLDFRPQTVVNAGIQKQILQKKGSLKLTVQDLLHNNFPRASSSYRGYYEQFEAVRDTRFVQIAFAYRFGKSTANEGMGKRSAADEEKKRASYGS